MSEQPFCKKQNDLSHAQTEALRLADICDDLDLHSVAAELRRLHEEVQEQCRINGMGAERELKLLTEKRELLEALRVLSLALEEAPGRLTPKQRSVWEKSRDVLCSEGGWA